MYAGTFSYWVDGPGEPTGAGGFYTLRVTVPPPPVITSVVNAASLRVPIAPGAVVSIFGTHLASPAKNAPVDPLGMYPTEFGNTTVTVNGVPAPITYAAGSQMNVLVPHEAEGASSARVVVRHFSQSSAEFVVPIQSTSPAIFTVSQDGNGQASAIQTEPGSAPVVSRNGPENPAGPGTIITLFATGAGLWNQEVPVGQLLLAPQWEPIVAPRAAVSLTIGGKQARLLYAGAAGTSAGMLQVNAVVPDGLAPGPQLVELTAGTNSNGATQQVTISVR